MSALGHNKGPTMERGGSWRRYAWKRARRDLLPNTIPVEVVRMRVRRARELGLDYGTYAGVRATTGRDLVAILFSSNALRLRGEIMAADRSEKLEALQRTGILALIHAPTDPGAVLRANRLIDAATRAPTLFDPWPAIRAKVAAPLGTLPRDGILVIGETGLEREWCAAGRLAGYVPAERYFGT